MPYAHNTTISTNVLPGVPNFLFCPRADFTTIQKPAGPFTTQASMVTISTAHVNTGTKGFYRGFYVPEKNEAGGTSTGPKHGKIMVNEGTVFIPGLDATNIGQLVQLQNEDALALLNIKSCDDPLWMQWGDNCRGVEFSPEYKTGTFEPTGEKGVFLKVKWTGNPYIYTGTITYNAD